MNICGPAIIQQNQKPRRVRWFPVELMTCILHVMSWEHPTGLEFHWGSWLEATAFVQFVAQGPVLVSLWKVPTFDFLIGSAPQTEQVALGSDPSFVNFDNFSRAICRDCKLGSVPNFKRLAVWASNIFCLVDTCMITDQNVVSCTRILGTFKQPPRVHPLTTTVFFIEFTFCNHPQDRADWGSYSNVPIRFGEATRMYP